MILRALCPDTAHILQARIMGNTSTALITFKVSYVHHTVLFSDAPPTVPRPNSAQLALPLATGKMTAPAVICHVVKYPAQTPPTPLSHMTASRAAPSVGETTRQTIRTAKLVDMLVNSSARRPISKGFAFVRPPREPPTPTSRNPSTDHRGIPPHHPQPHQPSHLQPRHYYTLDGAPSTPIAVPNARRAPCVATVPHPHKPKTPATANALASAGRPNCWRFSPT